MDKALRAVSIPWTDSLKAGLYELSSGRQLTNADFTKSVWANACMNIRGMELANLPWRLMRNDKPVENHAVEAMLRDFGRESFWEDAMQSTEIDKLRHGAAFWLRDYDVIKRLNPGTITVITEGDPNTREYRDKFSDPGKDGILGFVQKLNHIDEPNYFDRDEIIYFKGYHPDDDLGPGIPIAKIVQSAINTEYEAELMIQALFRNDASPGMLFTTEQHVPEAEAERIVGWFNARFRGSRRKGKIGVLDRGLTPVPKISQTMVETEVMKVREMARTDICVGFRVSKLLVSAFIDSSYANAGESRRSLIENLIVPEAKLYANAINQDLMAQVDKSIRFEFVPEELPIMKEDESAKVIRLTSMYSAGIISAEYYREQMGIEEKDAPKDEEKAEKEKVEKQYEKKALKAMARGETPDVSFETDVLSVDRRILIAARLKNAETVEDVKRAFNG